MEIKEIIERLNYLASGYSVNHATNHAFSEYPEDATLGYYPSYNVMVDFALSCKEYLEKLQRIEVTSGEAISGININELTFAINFEDVENIEYKDGKRNLKTISGKRVNIAEDKNLDVITGIAVDNDKQEMREYCFHSDYYVIFDTETAILLVSIKMRNISLLKNLFPEIYERVIELYDMNAVEISLCDNEAAQLKNTVNQHYIDWYEKPYV